MDRAKQEELMDAVFPHKVGELVLLKAQADQLLTEVRVNTALSSFERWRVPTPSTILERQLVQCHGGVQGFYMLRRMDGEGRAVGDRFATHEIVSYTSFLEQFKEATEATSARPPRDGATR